jgi:hypothetical protein
VWAHGRPRSIRGRCATCAHGLHLVPRLPTFALSGPLPCPLRVRPDARPARRCCAGPVRAALDARPAVSWTLDSPASAPSSTDVVTPTGHRARRPPAAGVGPLGEGPTGASAFDRRKALTLPAAFTTGIPRAAAGRGKGGPKAHPAGTRSALPATETGGTLPPGGRRHLQHRRGAPEPERSHARLLGPAGHLVSTRSAKCPSRAVDSTHQLGTTPQVKAAMSDRSPGQDHAWIGFLNRVSQVRVLPGALAWSR